MVHTVVLTKEEVLRLGLEKAVDFRQRQIEEIKKRFDAYTQAVYATVDGVAALCPDARWFLRVNPHNGNLVFNIVLPVGLIPAYREIVDVIRTNLQDKGYAWNRVYDTEGRTLDPAEVPVV